MTSDNVIPMRRPVRWEKLRTDEAERLIRELAQDTNKVTISDHAFEREDERSALTTLDVLDIIRTGHAEGEPTKDKFGDWKVIMTKRMPGSREAGAVTVIIGKGERLVIPTVQWMDTRR